MFKSLNIIGYGYVGSAIGYVCEKNNINFNVCDLQQKEGNFNFYTSNVENLITFSENENDMNYYFIAVPTPSNKDDSCNTSIIDNVLNTLNNKCTKKTIVLIKSTLVPGSCQTFHNRYTNLDIILLPEFLREASYKDDMYNAEFVLIGLPQSICHNTSHWILYEELTNLCKRLYKHNKDIDIYIKSYEECELFKYTLNVHLAVKVWYFNEIYEISEKLGVDYTKLKSLFNLDKRIGEYGTRVPGHDGKFGYGLSCLPKETRGMMKLQESLGIDNSVLKEIIKRNNYFRTK
jgi:UDPglucose 6-dehydrogenase